jgi:hypothetical protein
VFGQRELRAGVAGFGPLSEFGRRWHDNRGDFRCPIRAGGESQAQQQKDSEAAGTQVTAPAS